MKESIELTIAPDGSITAVTHGMHGERCLDMFALLEQLTNGRIVESQYKQEYFETRLSAQNIDEVKGGNE